MKNLGTLLFIIAVLIQNPLSAQNQIPINSNYLIEHGISPRVLDAAASIFMQDGHYSLNVVMTQKSSGQTKKYDLDLIYDPDYKEGMDIKVVARSASLNKKERKALKKYIERSHYFSRMARDYLYDESTLKFLKSAGDTIVLTFYYQKKDIDTYLKNIKRLRGEIYLVNGQLDRVVLTNTQPMKKHIVEFQRIVRYAKVHQGGYIVTSVMETVRYKKGNKEKKYESLSQILNYTDKNGKELTWINKKTRPPVEKALSDTIDVKLGGPLPLLGKEAIKLGYQLPRPIGVAGFVYTHDQLMEFTGLKVALDGGNMVDLQNIFALNDSKVTQSSDIYLAKADVWVFPFLNIMAIVGGGVNDLNGKLVINEELRDFFNDLPGWIIDVPNLPESLPINTSIKSEIYGGGATLAGAVGNFNLTLNYQLMFTKMIEANTTNMINIITPMVGYMLPFGINIMAGAQGQFYNTQLTGFFDFEDTEGIIHRIDYIVDFEPIKWNAILGVYKGFTKHLEMSVQIGFGQRASVTAVFGYRF